MVQAHHGFIKEDGRFAPENLFVKLPINKRVIVIWEEEPASKQEAVLVEAQTAVKNSGYTDDEILADVMEMRYGRGRP